MNSERILRTPNQQLKRKKRWRREFVVCCGNYKLRLGERTVVMGIVNCTPDSFSKDGCLSPLYDNQDDFVHRAERRALRFIKEGADIIDIGGESTRPGADRIHAREEVERVIPVIKSLVKKIDVPISIDTYKPLVARKALDAGACIVNNIMGTRLDGRLLSMVRDYKAAIILMHIRGTPRTMQKNIFYNNLIKDIISELKDSIAMCLDIGIDPSRIIIDPGIGFGKTVEDNLKIINKLEEFGKLKYPILIGTSRKSFIGKILDKEVDKRLAGTIASVCAAVVRGAHIVRVHDVRPVKEAITIMDAILNSD